LGKLIGGLEYVVWNRYGSLHVLIIPRYDHRGKLSNKELLLRGLPWWSLDDAGT
jgi:hypothetical protein